jgi:hypothetical protein
MTEAKSQPTDKDLSYVASLQNSFYGSNSDRIMREQDKYQRLTARRPTKTLSGIFRRD